MKGRFKKIANTLCVVMLLSSCGSNANYHQETNTSVELPSEITTISSESIRLNDLTRMHLNGQIKKMELTVSYDNELGRMTDKCRIEFNKDGNVTYCYGLIGNTLLGIDVYSIGEIKWIPLEGTSILLPFSYEHKNYKYDEEGRVLSVDMYFAENYVGRILYEYKDDKVYYYQDGIGEDGYNCDYCQEKWTWEYTLDENGYVISSHQMESSADCTFTRDSDGRILYDSDGLYGMYDGGGGTLLKYSYNEKGFISEIGIFEDKDGDVYYDTPQEMPFTTFLRISYEYDAKGNWTKQVKEYSDGNTEENVCQYEYY